MVKFCTLGIRANPVTSGSGSGKIAARNRELWRNMFPLETGAVVPGTVGRIISVGGVDINVTALIDGDDHLFAIFANQIEGLIEREPRVDGDSHGAMGTGT